MLTRYRESRERERKAVEKSRVEGRAEGWEEAYNAWAEWNERRQEAERNNTPFNELPPSNPPNGKDSLD